MTPRRILFALVVLAVVAVSAGPAAATGPPVPVTVAQRADAVASTAQVVPAAGHAWGVSRQPAPKRRAAVGCVGASCQGKYAADQGCRTDRIEVGGFDAPAANGWAAATFTLWHSPACRSAWAEYDSQGDAFSRVLRLESIQEYGTPDTEFQVPIGGPGNYPTQMVTWDDSVRLCDSFGGQCTSWR